MSRINNFSKMFLISESYYNDLKNKNGEEEQATTMEEIPIPPTDIISSPSPLINDNDGNVENDDDDDDDDDDDVGDNIENDNVDENKNRKQKRTEEEKSVGMYRYVMFSSKMHRLRFLGDEILITTFAIKDCSGDCGGACLV